MSFNISLWIFFCCSPIISTVFTSSVTHTYPCRVLLLYLQKKKKILLKSQDSFPLFSKNIVVTQSHRLCQCFMCNSANLYQLLTQIYLSHAYNVFYKNFLKSLDSSNQVLTHSAALIWVFDFLQYFSVLKNQTSTVFRRVQEASRYDTWGYGLGVIWWYQAGDSVIPFLFLWVLKFINESYSWKRF